MHTPYRQADLPLCVCHDGKYLISDSRVLNSSVFFVFWLVKGVFTMLRFTLQHLKNSNNKPFFHIHVCVFIQLQAKCSFWLRFLLVMSCMWAALICTLWSWEKSYHAVQWKHMSSYLQKKKTKQKKKEALLWFWIIPPSLRLNSLHFPKECPETSNRAVFHDRLAFLSCTVFIGQQQHVAVLWLEVLHLWKWQLKDPWKILFSIIKNDFFLMIFIVSTWKCRTCISIPCSIDSPWGWQFPLKCLCGWF